MTFLKTRYRLAQPLNEQQLERLPRLASVYGIRGIAVEGQDLVVEYDASRIQGMELLAEVRAAGIAVTTP